MIAENESYNIIVVVLEFLKGLDIMAWVILVSDRFTSLAALHAVRAVDSINLWLRTCRAWR